MHGTDDHDDERPSDGVRSVDEWRDRLYALLGLGFTDGNEVRVLRNGDEIFPAMLETIRGAERSLDLLSYIWWRGEITERICDAICERAESGVDCNVLLDAFGARKMESACAEKLRASGVDLRFFRDLDTRHALRLNHRIHRRAATIAE